MSEDVATSLTVKVRNLTQPMESAEKMRAIGRDRSTSDTVNFDFDGDVITVALPDGNFESEVDSAKVTGDSDIRIGLMVPMTLPTLHSLSPDTKVTIGLPKIDQGGERRTQFALVTTSDSEESKKGSLPITGYWAAVPFIIGKR